VLIFLLQALAPRASLDYVHISRAGTRRLRLPMFQNHNICKSLGGLHEIPSAS
jgi:hypothetical protein